MCRPTQPFEIGGIAVEGREGDDRVGNAQLCQPATQIDGGLHIPGPDRFGGGRVFDMTFAKLHCLDGKEQLDRTAVIVWLRMNEVERFGEFLGWCQERAAAISPFGAGSEEHTSELQSLMRLTTDVFSLKK